MPDNNELQLNFSNKVDVLQNKSNTTSVFLVSDTTTFIKQQNTSDNNNDKDMYCYYRHY